MFIQFKPKKHTYSIVIYSLHLYILDLITYFTYLKLIRCYTQFKTNYVMNYSNIVFINYIVRKSDVKLNDVYNTLVVNLDM